MRRSAPGSATAPPDGCPRRCPRRVASASARTPAISSAGAAVTRLASVVVVPWRRWNSAAPAISGRRPRVGGAAAAVHMHVDKPGHHNGNRGNRRRPARAAHPRRRRGSAGPRSAAIPDGRSARRGRRCPRRSGASGLPRRPAATVFPEVPDLLELAALGLRRIPVDERRTRRPREPRIPRKILRRRVNAASSGRRRRRSRWRSGWRSASCSTRWTAAASGKLRWRTPSPASRSRRCSR